MQKPFSERRYSDEELSRILDEAASAEQSAGGNAGEQGGHTLAEIRDIAREAGIDPDAVDRAAARIVASGNAALAPRERSGFRRGGRDGLRLVHEERVIPRSLSDAEMRTLAEQVELAMNQSGRFRQWGDWVEWRDDKDRLYVGVVRGQGQTRIRVIADQLRASIPGLVAIGFVAWVAIGATSGPGFGLPLLVIAVAAASKYWAWRAEKTRDSLKDLLDMLEDAVQTH